jgi:hypothetical protein
MGRWCAACEGGWLAPRSPAGAIDHQHRPTGINAVELRRRYLGVEINLDFARRSREASPGSDQVFRGFAGVRRGFLSSLQGFAGVRRGFLSSL